MNQKIWIAVDGPTQLERASEPDNLSFEALHVVAVANEELFLAASLDELVKESSRLGNSELDFVGWDAAVVPQGPG